MDNVHVLNNFYNIASDTVVAIAQFYASTFIHNAAGDKFQDLYMNCM